MKSGAPSAVWLRWQPAITAVAAAVVLSPVLLGKVPWGDDTISHLNWAWALANEFRSGVLFPSWLTDYNGGLGSPDLFFYPPFTGMLAALVALAGPAEPFDDLPLKVTLFLGLFLSGMACATWLRNFVDPGSALISSLVYMVLPYHTAIDLYWRMAVAEFWAFVWFPLILHAVHGIVREARYATYQLVLFYALLILTHLPTTLFLSPLPPLYAWLIAPAGRRLRIGSVVVGGMGIAIALCAFYLVPALGMQGTVQIDSMWPAIAGEGTLWWLMRDQAFAGIGRSGFVMNLDVHLHLAAMTTVMAGLACLPFLHRGGTVHPKRPLLLFWFEISAATLFLVLPVSEPVWRNVPLLVKIQFPWRMLAIPTVGCAAILALALTSTRPRRGRGPLLVGVAVASGFWLAQALVLGGVKTAYAPGDLSRVAQMRTSNAEYLPIWAGSGAPTGDVRPEPTPGGTGRVIALERMGQRLDLRVATDGGMTLVVPRYYFPIWRVSLVEAGVELPSYPSVPDGRIAVAVPAGSWTIRVDRILAVEEKIGLAISVLAVMLAAGLWALAAFAPPTRRRTGKESRP